MLENLLVFTAFLTILFVCWIMRGIIIEAEKEKKRKSEPVILIERVVTESEEIDLLCTRIEEYANKEREKARRG